MVYFVVTQDGNSMLKLPTADGEEALAVFETYEDASEFIAGARDSFGWRPDRRDDGGAEIMLYKGLREVGTKYLAVNPRYGETPTRLILVAEALDNVTRKPARTFWSQGDSP